ncbi:MAG: glycosyltransferase family 4 protein [Nitrospiraceae bacterium]|nr:glycosyltransferase family 4 protein [Nitrospiraceae bacterium]
MLLAVMIGVGLLSWWLANRLSSGNFLLFHVDHPNERSLHEAPVPRTGGIAVLMSVLIGLIIVSAMGTSMVMGDATISWWSETTGLIVGLTVFLGFISFLDDRRKVPIVVRLGCQLAAASILVVVGGLQFPSFTVPFIGRIDFWFGGGLITILFLVWMTNLYNFMDGMDGFASGITVIGCGLLGYLGWQAQHPVITVIATLQSAAASGFLVRNFPPAKIFMGDVGSVPIGFLVAALIVLGCRDGVFDLWVPVIIFSPFILDATVTLVQRAYRHEKVWEAHRNHFYQRLVLSGWGHRRTVLAEYGVMVLCGGFALFYQYASEGWQLAILGFWGMLFLILALAVRGIERRIQPVSF